MIADEPELVEGAASLALTTDERASRARSSSSETRICPQETAIEPRQVQPNYCAVVCPEMSVLVCSSAMLSGKVEGMTCKIMKKKCGNFCSELTILPCRGYLFGIFTCVFYMLSLYCVCAVACTVDALAVKLNPTGLGSTAIRTVDEVVGDCTGVTVAHHSCVLYKLQLVTPQILTSGLVGIVI